MMTIQKTKNKNNQTGFAYKVQMKFSLVLGAESSQQYSIVLLFLKTWYTGGMSTNQCAKKYKIKY